MQHVLVGLRHEKAYIFSNLIKCNFCNHSFDAPYLECPGPPPRSPPPLHSTVSAALQKYFLPQFIHLTPMSYFQRKMVKNQGSQLCAFRAPQSFISHSSYVQSTRIMVFSQTQGCSDNMSPQHVVVSSSRSFLTIYFPLMACNKIQLL